MQMICEAYALMQGLLGSRPAEMGAIFSEWNQGMLGSFLIEITADILKQKDPMTKKPIVDVILDTAGQKGTGKWTSVNALDMGVPAPTIAESVFARCLSAVKEERVAASKILKGPPSKKYKGAQEGPHRRPSTTPSTAPRSAPTPRASSSCAPRRSNTSGNSTSVRSPRSGAAAASSAPSSSRRSPRPTNATRSSRTSSSIRISTRP
jgi:hypothetical protein